MRSFQHSLDTLRHGGLFGIKQNVPVRAPARKFIRSYRALVTRDAKGSESVLFSPAGAMEERFSLMRGVL
jgi:hypothetical protein